MSNHSHPDDLHSSNPLKRSAEEDPQMSPSQIALTGHDFSPEDIQDLLGGVLMHPHHHHADDGVREEKAQARTERKRSREKQRRSDVNKQFEQLTTVLQRIEGETHSAAAAASYAVISNSSAPSNRADLIARTVGLLNSLHESNKRSKVELQECREQLERAQKAGEETAAKLKESMMAPQNVGGNKVIMMVPMMIGGSPGGEGGGAPAGMPFMPTDQATAAMPWMHAMNGAAAAMPWMNQHAMMMQGAAAMQAPMFPPPMATAAGAAGATENGSQKKESKKQPASNGNGAVGSNLAHCA